MHITINLIATMMGKEIDSTIFYRVDKSGEKIPWQYVLDKVNI